MMRAKRGFFTDMFYAAVGMRQLPTSPWMDEVGQRMEQLPASPWMDEVGQRMEQLPDDSVKSLLGS